jgi:hypothetical protein
MSLQLKIDDMLEVLERLDHPDFSGFKNISEILADQMAAQITKALPVECGKAHFEGLAFAGLCVPFWGEGNIPEALQGLDDDGWEA